MSAGSSNVPSWHPILSNAFLKDTSRTISPFPGSRTRFLSVGPSSVASLVSFHPLRAKSKNSLLFRANDDFFPCYFPVLICSVSHDATQFGHWNERFRESECDFREQNRANSLYVSLLAGNSGRER